MNKNESEKKPNRIRKFCSDHSLAIIGGVAALGAISTIVGITLAKESKPETDYEHFGRVLLNDVTEKGYAFYYDDRDVSEIVDRINESDKVISQDALDIMKALITDAKIVEPGPLI